MFFAKRLEDKRSLPESSNVHVEKSESWKIYILFQMF
jgi:hypothetical protein